ncbi:MAG: class I SAM-dependent methyltransferase [Deltaproteobacteria bacterium]|nr:class I SAM-dependent methyltransferase [Deltaproteobacteria bacterium]
MDNDNLTPDAQKQHWEQTLAQRRDMFGAKPSEAARKAAKFFVQEGECKIIELGAGQGRDTLLFAQRGFSICALDYAQSGLDIIKQKREGLGLTSSVALLRHDVREPLPFRDESFDACYSHMLYCMALTTAELEFLSAEVRRVLKPGGVNVYTVRHTGDLDYGKGVHRGEDIYENNGFAVHFFSRELVLDLAREWEVIGLEQLEEGRLPRKLFYVTLKKPGPRIG